MKETFFSSHWVAKFDKFDKFDLPTKKVIKLKVVGDSISVDINLTKDEALGVIRNLAKELDVVDVLAAVTEAAKGE